MSAQVIANALGLPLYRINLAQVISKYIGETAKNLDAIFTEARNSNVVLFFDEADALFAKRTDVKDSNDRHANSESAYLLQKVEEYPGVSILATNLMHNFDEAFRRRINYMVNIGMPSPEQRLLLWQQMAAAGAPLGDDVDLQTLARELEFSGSVIKSASLQAAFYAAEAGGVEGCIAMRDYIRAVRLELNKLGKSEPHFLAAWPE
jgi:SpoVK/Ycf46/Vps4 family AAA+-type ATPase